MNHSQVVLPLRDAEHPALALGMNATCNGKEYLTIDFDCPVTQACVRTQMLQKFFDLHDAWIYKTKNGASVRFYTDFLDRGKINRVLQVSGCDPNYAEMVKLHGCSYRVSGKWVERDLRWWGVLANPDVPPVDEDTKKIAESLHRLALELMRFQFPKKVLMEESDGQSR